MQKIFFTHHSLCVNVLLQVDDGKHVLVEQVLVLHLLCHHSEEVDDDECDVEGDNCKTLLKKHLKTHKNTIKYHKNT